MNPLLEPVAPMAHTPGAFSPEVLAHIRQVTEELVPFNRFLGLQLRDIGPEHIRYRLHARPELRGHLTIPRIHGGAISAALDAVAVAALMAAICAKFADEPLPQLLQRVARLSTIDLRVDFLRPGLGEVFEASAQVRRMGSRVASVGMAFQDAEGALLATGTAAYMVS